MPELVSLRKDKVHLTRDVQAIEIPAGVTTNLAEESLVYVLHEMGGDFTVRTILGHMYRIEGRDADALGKEVPELAKLNVDPEAPLSEDLVLEQLATVFDPEIPVNIVELGLIYEVALKQEADLGVVEIAMTLTAPGCGMGQVLMDDVRRRVERLPQVDEARVDLTFDPPWTPERMSEEARLTTGLM